MKKSLLILSMMAIASTAFAADAPTAGTAAAPNYYVIKANRGIQYLAYGRSDQAAVDTKLTRTNELSEANIWAITPGTVENTVVIKSYKADEYLMNFVDASGEPTTELNATAVTTTAPVDIVFQKMEEAYAIQLYGKEGYITLDAPGGTKDYCGNWVPTNPSSGEGASFWFYQVDLANGVEAGLAAVQKAIEDEAAAIEEAAKRAAMESEQNSYIGWLEDYAKALPMVAEYFTAGIEEVKNVSLDNYHDEIIAAWTKAQNDATEALKTVLNGKDYAIKNMRRVTSANGAAYLEVGTDALVPATTYASDKAVFTFKSVGEDGGYNIYNNATQTYFAIATVDDAVRIVPTATEADAQIFYPAAGWASYNGLLFGMSFGITAAGSGEGLNWHSTKDAEITTWSVGDSGSIWQLIDADPTAAVEEMAAQYEAKYQGYIEAVPEVKDILEAALADIKKLTFSETMGEEAVAIDTKAMEDANAVLATCYADKVVSLFNYRTNACLGLSEENGFLAVADASAANVAFTMKAVEGGYVLYNNDRQVYISRAGNDFTADWSNNQMTVSADESEAAKVTVTLGTTDGNPVKYGVNLMVSEDMALHQSGNNLLFYYGNCNGSIWTVAEFVEDSINAIQAESKVMEGIYDLQGRKLAAPVKGINIINGKKVLVK